MRCWVTREATGAAASSSSSRALPRTRSHATCKSVSAIIHRAVVAVAVAVAAVVAGVSVDDVDNRGQRPARRVANLLDILSPSQ